MLWSETLQSHRTVGNPDAFMIEIHHPRFCLEGGFLRPSAGEKGAMEDG